VLNAGGVKACLSVFGANQINMVSSGIILRRQGWLAVVLGLSVLSEAHAAFSGLVPLSYSGQVAYSYTYVENAGSQSEATSLLFGLGASGYIWRPWFATTSLALSAGLSSTNSTSSRSEGTVGTGSFSVAVFPGSRFPFSISYSRTDSRSEQFQDISQISGSTSFRVTRLTLRQSYRPRAYNQLYNGWYSSTEYDGGSFGSSSEVYGLNYQLRIPQQTLTIDIAHTSTRARNITDESSVNMVSLGHVYTPSAELGVNSLVSYVEVDPIGNSGTSTDSQAFSSFFWRPEYRAVRVSGGVRLSETKSGMATEASRSLSTNLGLGYQISRSLSMNAGASLSTSESGSSQTLSTAQTAGLSYSGGQTQWRGISHSWQWNVSASNTTTQVETNGVASNEGSPSSQNISSGIGHNLGKSWATGSANSLAATFSQSLSGSKNSEIDDITTSVNQGVGLSWSSRGRRGTTYVSGRFNDSRSFSDEDIAVVFQDFSDPDAVFQSFSLSYSTDVTFGRLSSMSGSSNYQATQSATTTSLGEEQENSSRSISGGLSYRHNRPFGVYNLRFTSSLQGSKQIASASPTSTLKWRGVFRYSLGLLSTALSFNASQSAGGNIIKSMNFQATRSF